MTGMVALQSKDNIPLRHVWISRIQSDDDRVNNCLQGRLRGSVHA